MMKSGIIFRKWGISMTSLFNKTTKQKPKIIKELIMQNNQLILSIIDSIDVFEVNDELRFVLNKRKNIYINKTTYTNEENIKTTILELKRNLIRAERTQNYEDTITLLEKLKGYII